MRLDHLLSREPIFGEQFGAACWVVPGCFLVPACVYCPIVGGGCGCVFRVGHLNEASMLSGSRSTPCERLPPCCWVVGACAAGQLLLLVWVVCGGLFVICIVVASIFVLYCFLCFV